MDAVPDARNTLAVSIAECLIRGGQAQVAPQSLTDAREQLIAEGLRGIRGARRISARLRTQHRVRRALSSIQIRQIAGWRPRDEPLGVATAPVEAVRLAARVAPWTAMSSLAPLDGRIAAV